MVNVAIVGATGAVGVKIREILLERRFPFSSLKFLASEKSAGQELHFAGKNYRVEPLDDKAFENVQLVLSSTPGSVSRTFSPLAAQAGAYVIDNSSAWRMDPDCPLVVPEVNGEMVATAKKRIIANPNCVAIPLTVALHPLRSLAPMRRLVVATYQSSSGKGAKGLQDLDAQAKPWALGEAVPPPSAHAGQLAGNVLTLDWTLEENGYTEEENKVIKETRKILGLSELLVNPTCVRVPVRIAHSLAVTVEFTEPVSAEAAVAQLQRAAGITYLSSTSASNSPQPLTAAGKDQTFVGRVRHEPDNPCALSLWIVADNLRKGAATNAIQCAEELLNRQLL